MKAMARAVCLGLGMVVGHAAWADDPAAFPDFTFKSAKPPKAGAKKRITVQITPEEFAAQTASPDAGSVQSDGSAQDDTVVAAIPKAPSTGLYAWFWDTVPTGVSDAALLRLESALIRLSKPPAGEAVPQFRLQALQAIAVEQGESILKATAGTQVSPALVLAVIAVESGGRRDATSRAGAEGLMQLIPATADRFGVEDAFAADQNIMGGVAYLDWLLKEFDGDPILALAGYNAGENAVKDHKGVPPFVETRDYVPLVLAAYDVARGLCKTRPQFITDGCALNLAAAN